jgi:tRNA(Ile)-lysidine synthase
LKGMRPRWAEHGVHWSRPFLHMGREDLRGYLRRQGVGWIDDPSNENDRFSRVKMRKALRVLAPLGITVERLSETAQHLASARQALNYAVVELAEAAVTEQAGGLTITRKTYRRLMPDMQRRLLLAMIGWMGGAGYPPRSAALFRLELALVQGRDATLGGVRFRVRGDLILVTREARAVLGAVPMGQLWDHRWRVTGPLLEGAEIAALGAHGLQDCPDFRAHAPREVLLTSPALWQNGRLIAAPLAGKAGEYRVELQASLTQFILSH